MSAGHIWYMMMMMMTFVGIIFISPALAASPGSNGEHESDEARAVRLSLESFCAGEEQRRKEEEDLEMGLALSLAGKKRMLDASEGDEEGLGEQSPKVRRCGGPRGGAGLRGSAAETASQRVAGAAAPTDDGEGEPADAGEAERILAFSELGGAKHEVRCSGSTFSVWDARVALASQQQCSPVVISIFGQGTEEPLGNGEDLLAVVDGGTELFEAKKMGKYQYLSKYRPAGADEIWNDADERSNAEMLKLEEEFLKDGFGSSSKKNSAGSGSSGNAASAAEKTYEWSRQVCFGGGARPEFMTEKHELDFVERTDHCDGGGVYVPITRTFRME